MYKQRRLIIAIIISMLFILGGCSNQKPEIKTMAENGVVDLREIELEDSIVRLDGQWEFYWNQLIAPGQEEAKTSKDYIEVPSSWNKYIGNEKKSGYGYATYILQFITSENIELGLKIPRMFTAYNMWINGELIASAGNVGETEELATPQYLPQVEFFESEKGINEIVVQVSNFHHRSGGMLESINLGGKNQITRLRNIILAGELAVFGSLMFIGAHHLAVFLFRRKNTPSLYFSLFCLSVSIRTLLVGERFFIYLFPNFNWEIAHKIQTLVFYYGVVLVLMFFKSLYPNYFNSMIIKIAKITGTVFGFLVIFAPARIYTLFNPIYQVWALFAIIHILVELVKVWINKEDGYWYITLGALALLLGSVSDIIFLNIWVNDGGPSFIKSLIRTGSLSSFGQLIFAYANSLFLSKQFSDSLVNEKNLTEELLGFNENLDKLVLERTKDLENANKKIGQQKLELEKTNRILNQLSLKDPLTGLWNRRKLSETIEIEWNRSLRYKKPITLLLLDIDYFKQFNDLYGHIEGDKCLTKIGETLKNSFTRSTDLVARYGGEEFIVLLPETEKDEAMKISETLRMKIESLKIPHEKSLVSDWVTVSIGVISAVADYNLSYDDIFEVVDKALYHAKDAGRNQIKYLSV